MCNFFSFVTDPINHPAEYYFFDWEYRKADLDDDGVDSHSHICAYYKLNEDKCNKYEYNPLTKRFEIDQINSERDDSKAAEKWAQRLDFKTIIEPLIIKPIVNPFELPAVEHVTDEQIDWLKSWASVRVSVWNSVRASIRASVGNSVGYSVWNSVWDSVWNSAEALVGAYISSFLDIPYQHDFTPAVKLWDDGLVPSFNDKTWRLLTGKDAKIIYEWTPDKEGEE